MTHKLSMMEDAEKDAQAEKTREAIRRMVENQGKGVTKKKSFYKGKLKYLNKYIK